MTDSILYRSTHRFLTKPSAESRTPHARSKSASRTPVKVAVLAAPREAKMVGVVSDCHSITFHYNSAIASSLCMHVCCPYSEQSVKLIHCSQLRCARLICLTLTSAPGRALQSLMLVHVLPTVARALQCHSDLGLQEKDGGHVVARMHHMWSHGPSL